MRKIAMIKNGVVECIATWNGVSEWNPEGYLLVDVTNIFCDNGYTYDGENFHPPEDQQA